MLLERGISQTFDKVLRAGLHPKLYSQGISGRIFGLFSFLSRKQFRVVLDSTFLQQYPVKSSVTRGFVLGPRIFINDLSDDAFCNIAIYVDDITLYSMCGKSSDLWQQQEFACELESDLRYTVNKDRKRLADFSTRKTQLVSFDFSSNCIDVKMDGSLLDGKLFLRWWDAFKLD